jgi:hypothetical protein
MTWKTTNYRAALELAALSALALALATPGATLAQEAAPVADAALAASSVRTTTYDAVYFSQFAPNTALDIVRRVPGFAIEQSDGEVRGFSQAAGNVVLNGARPSSKSESLFDILGRIPAGRVLRVEVGPGDLFGSDYAGKSQVLNVVMSETGGVSGNVKLSATRVHTGWTVFNGEASALIRTGGSTINLSASSGRANQVEVGYDAITDLATGERLEFRDKVNTIDPRNPAFAASWAREGAGGTGAHLNLRYAPSHFRLHQANHVTPASGPERDDRLTQDFRNTGYEIGGDIVRPLGSGQIKLVALANRRDGNAFDTYDLRPGGVSAGGSEFRQVSRYDEALGRLSWSTAKLLGFSTEIGSELAYNRLENETELFSIGPGGLRTRIDLPVDQAVVDEVRTESYLNLGRQLARELRLETRLAYETSRLEVSGDTEAERNLNYFKPSFTLDWTGPKGWHAQGVLRRTVAQLNFFDFISTAELANDRVNGGNANLVPQRAWEARLTIDRPVLGKGLVKLELGHDRVSKLQDRILTEEGFDAPGNIGTGTRSFAALTFDAPLDSLGIKATRLKLYGIVQDTNVRDPLSGQKRNWTGFFPDWRWEVELRRDLANWSYGASLFHRSGFTFYRIEEEDSNFNAGSFAIGFVEYRPDKRTTIRLDLENLTNIPGERRRLFFDPNRSAPAPAIEEFRSRNTHVGVALSVNRTF